MLKNILQYKKAIIAGSLTLLVITGLVASGSLSRGVTSAPNEVRATANNLTPIDPKTIGKLVRDSATGKDFISNQVIVEFKTEVSEEEALAIIAGVGGKMEQRFTAVPLFLIRVEDAGDGVLARSIVKKLLTDERVKRVDLNFLTTKPSN